MTKNNKPANLRNLLHERNVILLSIFLTLSLSFFTSVVCNAIISDYYTLRVLAIQTLLYSCISFIFILLLVYWKKDKVNSLFHKNVLPRIKRVTTSVSGILVLIMVIFIIFSLTFLIIPDNLTYKRPIFQYKITIRPIDNDGDICIYAFSNSTGSLLEWNVDARNYFESSAWERDINDCALFLKGGKQAEISFDNVGSINDEIIFLIKKGPDIGELEISSSYLQFDETIKYFLETETVDIQPLVHRPGNRFLRNLVDVGLVFGAFSLLFIIFLIFPITNSSWLGKKLLNLKEIINKIFLPHFVKSWDALNNKKVAIPVLFLLFILGVAYNYFVINPMAFGPSHFGDEIRYWNTSLSLSDGTFRAVDYYRYPPVYPLSLLPVFFFRNPIKSYEFAKLLNALYLTSAIFPGYLLIRKFEKRNIALITSVLLLLNPVHLVMPGRILSENIFYPLFLWSMLFAFSDVFPVGKHTRIVESLLLGISLGLLYLARYIALVLIPAFLLIWWLKPFKDEKPPLFISKEKIAHLILIILPLVLMVGCWIMVGVNEGLRVKDMLGLFIAEVPHPEQLTLGRLLMWTIFYCSYLVILASPYLPVLLASFSNFRLKNWNQDTNRWFIALLIVISALMIACIRHSWRIPYNYPFPQKLQGRYILYFGPLFLITTFANIRKSFLKTKAVQVFVYSSFLLLFSYSIINLGLIYVSEPLRVAVSSPDYIFMSLIGAAFILYPLANALLNSMLFKRDNSKLAAFLFLFLFGFAIFGNVKIHQHILNAKNQLDNSQIYHLLFSNELIYDEILKDNQTKLEIEYPSDTTQTSLIYWENTLDFYQITNYIMTENEFLDEDPNLIYQAHFDDTIINLQLINEAEYIESKNVKYTHRENYFEFLVLDQNEN